MEAARLYADCLNGIEDPVLIREAMRPTHEVFVSYLAAKYPGLYGNLREAGRVMPLRETMSFSDYQALFVDVLDRMYYGYYNAYPVYNKALVRVHQLRDFRVVSRYLLDGVVEPLTFTDAAAPAPQRALKGPVPQKNSSLATANDTSPIQYAPKLAQAMTSVNWRAFVNDDLGIFKDLANRLSIAGNRGISKFITGFYVDAAGPSATLYTTAYKNQIIIANSGGSTDNPELSVQGIIDGLNVLSAMTDAGGDPIIITGRIKLWFGPSLEGTANNVMSALNVYVQNQGGSTNTQGFPVQFLNVQPWMIQRMDPVMDPYIPIVCTTSGVKKTMWGMTVDPQAQARPAIEIGFLNGYETPQIYQKVPNTMRMGGAPEPMLGDFYTMDQDMKIVTVMGGVQIDGRSTVASTGQKV